MKKTLTALPLTVALLIPFYMNAQEHGDEHRGQHQYYDKKHKDYHQWNDNEGQAWNTYWSQQHRTPVAWESANERQRQNYWNWRHQHSDAVLQINIR